MGPWCGQMGLGGWLAMITFWVVVVAVVVWGVSRLFPAQPELDALPENPTTRQGAATQTLVAPRVVPAVVLAPVAAPAPVVAQPVTAAQPTTLTRPKKRTIPHEVRRIDGFDATSTDSVELLAVVQETPAGLIIADYQVNAASIQGQGQQGGDGGAAEHGVVLGTACA